MTAEQKREYHRKWYQKNKERIREKKKLNMRKYRKQNPKRYRAHSNKSTKKLKDSVFDMYGRKCVRCGFEDMRALTLDHILNNGAEERSQLGERGVYRRAAEKFRPLEYQTLCMNCQFIKRVESQRQNQHG